MVYTLCVCITGMLLVYTKIIILALDVIAIDVYTDDCHELGIDRELVVVTYSANRSCIPIRSMSDCAHVNT